MQKPLYIKGTKDCPQVTLDCENQIFEISGRSLPEDSAQFYAPVEAWLESYVKSPNSITEFNFRLDYFNSSSSRKIMSILFELEKIAKTKNAVKINWYYEESDEMIKESGEEIRSIVKIPFELKSYKAPVVVKPKK